MHTTGKEIILGKPTMVRSGESVCVLSTGGMLSVAVEAVDSLIKEQGLSPSLFSVHTLSKIDEEALTEVIEGHNLVVTCEEHSVVGGLGGLVAEHLAERNLGSRLVRIGLPHGFPSGIGSQEYLRELNSLDAVALARTISTEARVLSE